MIRKFSDLGVNKTIQSTYKSIRQFSQLESQITQGFKEYNVIVRETVKSSIHWKLE